MRLKMAASVVAALLTCTVGLPTAGEHRLARLRLVAAYDCQDTLVVLFDAGRPDDGHYQLQARAGRRDDWHTVVTVSGGENHLRWADWDRSQHQFRVQRTAPPATGAISNTVTPTPGCQPV